MEKNSFETTLGAFFHARWYEDNFNSLTIKDCIFENINIKSKIPLIESEQLELT